jgi:hypothetical protein
MRRYKNQRKYRRASKTFRQRKPLNLHRSSMKKFVDPRKVEWIGGTEPGDESDEKVPLVVKPASDETTETSPQEKTTTFTLGSDEAPVSAPAPATESTTEQPPVPESVPTPDSASTSESAPMPESAPEKESATMSESEQAQSPVNAVESAPEPEPEPETTKVDAIPTADAVPKQMDAENVNPEPASTTPSVADALNIIADKIATAVVTKMRENPTMGSYPNQDADIAVPLAVSAVVRQTQLAPEK